MVPLNRSGNHMRAAATPYDRPERRFRHERLGPPCSTCLVLDV